MPTAEVIPPAHGGLLARLDILVNLVADRRGLILDPAGRLAGAEARMAAEALGLLPPAGPGPDPSGWDPGHPGRPDHPARPGHLGHPGHRGHRGDQGPAGSGDPPGAGGPGGAGAGGSPSQRDLAAIELLRALAQAIGLVRDRGDRIEATTLRHPWRQLDPGLRAGLVYAAWCHRVPWRHMLDGTPAVGALHGGRTGVLRLLFGLPARVQLDLEGLIGTVGARLDLPAGEWLLRATAAVFLDPLVALGVADLDPAPPRLPARIRLSDRAETVIGSALIAAGEDLPLSRAG